MTNLEKWLQALEGDEFSQGKKRLRTEEGYCCLGVACEIYKRETGEGEWLKFFDESIQKDAWEFILEAKKSSALLPSKVSMWLLGEKPKYDFAVSPYLVANEDGDTRDSLTVLNDSGVSFKEIAAAVREHGVEA